MNGRIKNGFLNERQKKVLFCIVKEYIRTHKPVSSSKVLEISTIDYSSATIRNDMRKLEYLGYLKQPHTSAGRIPTDKALRFYLDAVMDMRRMRERGKEVEKDSHVYWEGDFSRILEGAVKIIAVASNGIAIVEKPKVEFLRISGVILREIDETRTLVVLSTELGLNESFTIYHPRDVKLEELESILNDKLIGRTIGDIRKSVSGIDIRAKIWYDKRLEELMKFFENLLNERFEEGFLRYGFQRIINNDLLSFDAVRKLMRILEDEETTKELLNEIYSLDRSENGVMVIIGEEHKSKDLKEFSTFIDTYKVFDRNVGRIAVITSKYTDYEKVVKTLVYISNRLTEFLTKLSMRR